ncbi:MAG TPA: RNA methyltransferase [Thermoanaerobaculia bacterium]|nr:RNA methyltransferase [Thermoanaerobaculia bacterium]
MQTLTSRHNPLFKRIREAIREHADEIVIEGSKFVDDAIAGGWKPIVILRSGIEISHELFDALAETKSPQGVLALFERPAPGNLFAREDTIVIALDGVQDPGNVGTIVRLAAAFDVGGVALLPGCADPYSPKSIRASAGAILTVPVAQLAIDELPWPLFVTDTAGAPIDPPARNAILVFGSEGRGVSSEIAKRAQSIAIRTSGRVESLNVAASAAILLSRSFELRECGSKLPHSATMRE